MSHAGHCLLLCVLLLQVMNTSVADAEGSVGVYEVDVSAAGAHAALFRVLKVGPMRCVPEL